MYLVSRTETFAKLFFIVSFTGLFMYVALAFYSFHTAYTAVSQIGSYPERFNNMRSLEEADRFDKDLKYILVWTVTKKKTQNLLGYEGQATFIEKNCPEINCYITTNKTILNDDYTNFDAIVFNTSLLWQWKNALLPKHRSKRQKYVFYGMQASDDHPICNVRVDNFFNWTWTYKFYSDIFSPFIEVKDLFGKVVAPSRNVIWAHSDEKASTKSDIEQVITKTKAIAWIIDDCNIKTNNMISSVKFQQALKEFSLTFDIYGCGNLKCPKEGCLKAIQRDYYFYLAYEGSVSEDYVTTEVLKAYHYDAVPIVVGGADYTKFLPDNSYINYQFYTEEKLAALIDHTIRNPTAYHEYFQWKKFYTIDKVEEFRGYCDLCKLLNDRNKFRSFSTYETFRTWWYYGSLKEKCLPKGAERFSDIFSYINESSRF